LTFYLLNVIIKSIIKLILFIIFGRAIIIISYKNFKNLLSYNFINIKLNKKNLIENRLEGFFQVCLCYNLLFVLKKRSQKEYNINEE